MKEVSDTPWHRLSADDVLSRLESHPKEGLSPEEAGDRLERFGPNRLPEEESEGPLRRFLKQFHNVLIYVLLGAALFTAFLQEWLDAGVILLVVLVNAAIGFVQEGKAEEAMEGIRKLLSLEAEVVRGGARTTVSAEALVPGDLVLLESGDRVPADLRILSAKNARAEEAVLTGESQPVPKGEDPVEEGAAVADRTCIAYSGTLLTSGRITGVVVGTGEGSEIGRIGVLVSRVERVTTPLLRKIDRFGTQLSVAIVAGSVLVFLVGWLVREIPPAEVFMAVVALAVAAIPEGLPAILTITLALGVQRMASRNAIVRRLPAVETLGSVTVVCTDKTGTLTRNEMSVEQVVLPRRDWRVSGSGYLPEGDFRLEERDASGDRDEDGSVEDSSAEAAGAPEDDPLLLAVMRAGLLCNESQFTEGDEGRVLQGDPTEGALLVLAEKGGLVRQEVEEEWPRVDILPFESERRWMATLHQTPDGGRRILLKGAPEEILRMASSVRISPEEEAPLEGDGWLDRMEEVAREGYRVLALAERSVDSSVAELREEDAGRDAILLGLVALMDPPRPEAIEAVEDCRSAGIRVLMITGDHAATARSIGARMGIGDGATSILGAEVADADDQELSELLAERDVVARASPEHKLRIVRRLQDAGEVCAMTGDGVNDAPALKQADIGVAMGIKGSEAAKSASEMVLADDNFATIARAVEEGRTVYDNLRKTILFILPTNGAEALIVLAAVVFAFAHLPISPVQILWVNMVTAVTLALALAFEPGEPGIMERPPRGPEEPILSRHLFQRIAYVSVLVAGGCILLFHWELARSGSPEYARTAVVNALVAAELWYLFNCRFLWQHSVGWRALVGNRAALVAVGVLLLLQGAFTYLPIFHLTFGTAPLELASWGPILLVGLLLYLVVETEKAFGRRRRRREPGTV